MHRSNNELEIIPATIHRDVSDAITARRWETARRLCIAALERFPTDVELLILMHTISRNAGDPDGCRLAVERIQPRDDADRFRNALLIAGDFNYFAKEQFYRTSQAKKAGYTLDEYIASMQRDGATAITEAERLATNDDQRRELAIAVGRKIETPVPAQPVESLATPTGVVQGTLTFPDDAPVAHALVTLGLAVDVTGAIPPGFFATDMDFVPRFPAQSILTTTTDAHGRFEIEDVRAGHHAFLAVTLDGDAHDIVTRYVAHGITVRADETTTVDAVISDWQSTPSAQPVSPMADDHLKIGSTTYVKVWEHRLANPFHFDFPRQLVSLPLPENVDASTTHLVLIDTAKPYTPITIQIVDGAFAFFDSLPEMSEHTLALYAAKQRTRVQPNPFTSMLRLNDDGLTATIDPGPVQFEIGWNGTFDQPPMLRVRGADNVWRGCGRLRMSNDVHAVARSIDILDDGAIVFRVRVTYELSDGSQQAFVLTAHRGESYLMVHEVSTTNGVTFEFSLAEFAGGRGYLHWKGGAGSADWSTLTNTDRELARLQESVPWWIPPAGFGYAMTPDGLAEEDFIGVFTIRRGDWVDRHFEAISRGPGDEPAWRRELEWPYPEMVGSTISMITAHTDTSGDAFFRFRPFDGERHWGLFVSTLDENDRPFKRISEVQHKNSSPTLQQFFSWHLDEPDTVSRPHVVATRSSLRELRRKRTSPAFARYWDSMTTGHTRHGAIDGLRFAVEGDPALGWRKKMELVGLAHVRSRMTLLGRDFSDAYSPVGGRPITKWAEEYDLLVASGAFTSEEERLVRAFLILMGHMYMSPDLMNWKFGSRNANFEADRVDVVGTIGVVFADHPDARTFTDHAIALMERSLNTYCTPGSGKWYENPACYYLQASKCRINLLVHLVHAGLFDPMTLPRLKDFLRWGILLLTPPTPPEYEVMRLGCDAHSYESMTKVRRIPPIGDHAHIGSWVPEHYALAATLYRKSDPAFADELMWAYLSGESDGGYFGNIPLLFAKLNEDDLRPAPAPLLTSRRLEGFGAVFRDRWNQPDEWYLLFKQGPGGYRYHRTEGSILLFADGKPLIYDGGEAGETWRHSTLSFHDVHMPLSPGHVERFHTSPAIDFCQGVHPLALKPGDPTFLNDVCEHTLVDVALQRYHEPRPANARSVWLVKGEYVVMVDELDIDASIPSFWHLQVVADSHTGGARKGYVFAGRFGTDLQVLLPNQTFADEKVEQLATHEYHRTPEMSFSMAHLQLRGEPGVKRYVAVLRPLGAQRPAVSASLIVKGGITCGLRVVGENIDDTFYFHRAGLDLRDGNTQFTGQYAAILRRSRVTTANLLAGVLIRTGEIELTSDGTTVKCSGSHLSNER